MCYSAQIEADYKKYVKMFGATMGIREFADLLWEHGGRETETPAGDGGGVFERHDR
jgi:hypothetical protein